MLRQFWIWYHQRREMTHLIHALNRQQRFDGILDGSEVNHNKEIREYHQLWASYHHTKWMALIDETE